MRHFFSHGRQGETELAHPVVIVADLEAHARSGTRYGKLWTNRRLRNPRLAHERQMFVVLPRPPLIPVGAFAADAVRGAGIATWA